jgi:uncharacterized phage infection (PIP) family protein YhgE
MVWITLVSQPTLQPFCVKVRSLEKTTKTERSQRSSTIQQSQPGTTIDIGDSDEDTPTVSNAKHKTNSRRPPASPKKPRLGVGGSYVEAIASAARGATKPAIDGPVKEAFRILLLGTINGLDGPELAEVQAEKDRMQRRYQKLQAVHATVNAELAAKEKALGDAATASKAERTKRKQLETQIAELRAQVRTHEEQASKGVEAASAEAQELVTTKRRNDELSAQVTILKGRITELQAMPERTDGAAQGSAEVEAALAEKNQELEKLKEALAEKDQEIARLKIAISTLVTK